MMSVNQIDVCLQTTRSERNDNKKKNVAGLFVKKIVNNGTLMPSNDRRCDNK